MHVFTAEEPLQVIQENSAHLSSWLTFFGVLITGLAGVTIAYLGRTRKELRSDHAMVAQRLSVIETKQDGIIEDIDSVAGSVRRVHDRLDAHLEAHGAHEDLKDRDPERRSHTRRPT